MSGSRSTSGAGSNSGHTQAPNDPPQQSASDASQPKPQRSFDGLSRNGTRMGRPPRAAAFQQSTPTSSQGAQVNENSEREINANISYLSDSANPRLWRDIRGTDLPTSIDTEGLFTVTAQPTSYALPHREDLEDWMRGGKDMPPLGSIINDPVLPDNGPLETGDDEDESESSDEENGESSEEDDGESSDEQEDDEEPVEEGSEQEYPDDSDEDEDGGETEPRPSRIVIAASTMRKRGRDEKPEDDLDRESGAPETKKARTSEGFQGGPMEAASQAGGAEGPSHAPRATNAGGEPRGGKGLGSGGQGREMVGRRGGRGRGSDGGRGAPPAS